MICPSSNPVLARLSVCFCESNSSRCSLSLPASPRLVSPQSKPRSAFLSTGVTSRRSTGSSASPSRRRLIAAFLVSVEREGADVALVHTLVQTERVPDRPAARAQLRRREEPVSDHEGRAVPGALVGELPSQLAHARIADRQREMLLRCIPRTCKSSSIARLRAVSFHALEEALERHVQVLQRRLADVRRDLIQPRRARLLQLHKLLLQVAEPRPYARELVLALRFGEAPSCRRSGTLRRSLRAEHAAPGSGQARTGTPAE
jgi:hypothetical protein